MKVRITLHAIEPFLSASEHNGASMRIESEYQNTNGLSFLVSAVRLCHHPWPLAHTCADKPDNVAVDGKVFYQRRDCGGDLGPKPSSPHGC